MMKTITIDPVLINTEKVLRSVQNQNQDYLSIDLNKEISIINIVNELILQGIYLEASDIHIEPIENYIRIRYRIDGVLIEMYRLPIKFLPPLTSRIKLIAEMDIAEKRLPQDGRIQIIFDNKKTDLRVSSLPTIAGEKIVLRILAQENRITNLEGLGLSELQLNKFKNLLKFPNGMLLVTGPTGSGKTTTLYASLTQLKTKTQNIVTIEDPVEYVLNEINQVQINQKAKLDFARGLKSILRQDPDIIMIGEIRDKETAEIAVRAATTGHLVLTTLHTNDAVSSLTRLVEMGIDNFFVASAAIGVVAQRLVRKICPHCKFTYEPNLGSREQILISKYMNNDSRPLKLSMGKGCSFCNYTGYKGRIIILEILQVNDAIRTGLLKNLDTHELKKIAIHNQMITLKMDGLDKVLQGITTLEEITRITYDGEALGV